MNPQRARQMAQRLAAYCAARRPELLADMTRVVNGLRPDAVGCVGLLEVRLGLRGRVQPVGSC